MDTKPHEKSTWFSVVMFGRVVDLNLSLNYVFCGMFYLVQLLDDFFIRSCRCIPYSRLWRRETVLRISCHNSWGMSLWVNFLEGLLCFPIKRGCFPFWQGVSYLCVYVLWEWWWWWFVRQGILFYFKGNESATIMTVLFSKRITTGRRK